MKKYRVMVDTTSLISGLVFGRVEHRLLKLAEEGKIILVLSDFIIEETRRILRLKFGSKSLLFNEFLEIIKPEIIEIKDYKHLIDDYKDSIEDPKDLPILTAAIKTKPDFFISGDKHFNTQKAKRLLNVISSRDLICKFDG